MPRVDGRTQPVCGCYAVCRDIFTCRWQRPASGQSARKTLFFGTAHRGSTSVECVPRYGVSQYPCICCHLAVATQNCLESWLPKTEVPLVLVDTTFPAMGVQEQRVYVNPVSLPARLKVLQCERCRHAVMGTHIVQTSV